MRVAALLILLLASFVTADEVPVPYLSGGMITASAPGVVFLREPWWGWEGPGTTFSIDRDGDALVLHLKIDISGPGYGHVYICQFDDGWIQLETSNSEHPDDDVTRAYQDWQSVVEATNDDTARWAKLALLRVGLGLDFEPQP